jgi:hypothetical protein
MICRHRITPIEKLQSAPRCRCVQPPCSARDTGWVLPGESVKPNVREPIGRTLGAERLAQGQE